MGKMSRFFKKIQFRPCRASQSDEDGKHQKGKGYGKKQQLEENSFLKPGSKADVRKAKTYEKRAACGVEDVRVSVRKEIGKYYNGCADALYRSKCEHGDDQNCLCGGTWDKEFYDKNEYVEYYYRKVVRYIRHGVIEIVEYRVKNIALLSDMRDAKGDHYYHYRGKDVLDSAQKAFSKSLVRAKQYPAYDSSARYKRRRHKYHGKGAQGLYCRGDDD